MIKAVCTCNCLALGICLINQQLPACLWCLQLVSVCSSHSCLLCTHVRRNELKGSWLLAHRVSLQASLPLIVCSSSLCVPGPSSYKQNWPWGQLQCKAFSELHYGHRTARREQISKHVESQQKARKDDRVPGLLLTHLKERWFRQDHCEL